MFFKRTMSLLFLATTLFFSQHYVFASERPQLILLWQTESILEVPESVLCVPAEKFFFVSNISGKPKEKNGKGFISKVSMDGEVIQLKWATDLNAPKGMAISGNNLYVSDINRLVQINLSNGKKVAEFPAPGSRFLNDVAADKAGNIYVSDSSKKNSVIYKLTDKKIDVWISGADILKPNGLYMEDGRLLIGNSGDGCIKSINLNDKTIETVAQIGGGIDGLQPVGNGRYIVSDWKGKTSIFTEGEVTVLMDTTPQKINSADLEYIVEKKTLIIPTFFDNRVVAYKVRM